MASRDEYVPIPYQKGRTESEIRSAITARDTPSSQLDIIDAPVHHIPLYNGPYGPLDLFTGSLNKLLPYQLDPIITLSLCPRGSYAYLRFIDQVPDIALYPGRLMKYTPSGDTEALIVSNTEFATLTEDLKKSKTVHYIAGVNHRDLDPRGDVIKEGAHALVLTIDSESGDIELFDPNGYTSNTSHAYHWIYLMKKILKFRGSVILTADEFFCPQGLSALGQKFAGEQQCSVWCYWYIWLCINNPAAPRKLIRRYMMSLSPDTSFDKVRRIARVALGIL